MAAGGYASKMKAIRRESLVGFALDSLERKEVEVGGAHDRAP